MATATEPELALPPAASIGEVEERELPPAPPLRKIRYPYIASQVGLMLHAG